MNVILGVRYFVNNQQLEKNILLQSFITDNKVGMIADGFYAIVSNCYVTEETQES